MRVAICSDGIFPHAVGGIQRHTRLLVESLAKHYPTIELVVVHTHVGKRVFSGLGNVEEITVAPRPGRRQYLIETYERSRRMADVLTRMPDAVIYAQGLAVWKNAKAFGPRLILNPHGLEAFQPLTAKDWLVGLPFRQAFKSIFKHAHAVVSLGGRLTSILERHVPYANARVVVIPNATNILQTPPRIAVERGDPLRLLFVGRFAENKGIPDLLAAMRLLTTAGQGDRYRLELVGDGPLYTALKRSTGLPNVHFHGAVDDTTLEGLYTQSDVLVLPTLFEGMPTVVLEAMAHRLLALVTDVGATRELVDDSNGRIIAKNDPPGLATALREISQLSPKSRTRLMNASWQKVASRFSWEAVAEQHIRLFKQIAAKASLPT